MASRGSDLARPAESSAACGHGNGLTDTGRAVYHRSLLGRERAVGSGGRPARKEWPNLRGICLASNRSVGSRSLFLEIVASSRIPGNQSWRLRSTHFRPSVESADWGTTSGAPSFSLSAHMGSGLPALAQPMHCVEQ